MKLMNLFLTMSKSSTDIKVGTAHGFCAQTANIWQIVGYVLLVFKIVIPLLLIILGMLDLGKAVIASKDDEIKKSITSLVKRAIAAVVIFLLPTIVSFLIGVIGGFNEEAKEDYDICRKCIVNPNNECQIAKDLWEK